MIQSRPLVSGCLSILIGVILINYPCAAGTIGLPELEQRLPAALQPPDLGALAFIGRARENAGP